MHWQSLGTLAGTPHRHEPSSLKHLQTAEYGSSFLRALCTGLDADFWAPLTMQNLWLVSYYTFPNELLQPHPSKNVLYTCAQR